jgi:hypothetical protein
LAKVKTRLKTVARNIAAAAKKANLKRPTEDFIRVYLVKHKIIKRPKKQSRKAIHEPTGETYNGWSKRLSNLTNEMVDLRRLSIVGRFFRQFFLGHNLLGNLGARFRCLRLRSRRPVARNSAAGVPRTIRPGTPSDSAPSSGPYRERSPSQSTVTP